MVTVSFMLGYVFIFFDFGSREKEIIRIKHACVIMRIRDEGCVYTKLK